MKVEGNEEMQESYNVLFGTLGENFFSHGRGEDVSSEDRKLLQDFSQEENAIDCSGPGNI